MCAGSPQSAVQPILQVMQSLLFQKSAGNEISLQFAGD